MVEAPRATRRGVSVRTRRRILGIQLKTVLVKQEKQYGTYMTALDTRIDVDVLAAVDEHGDVLLGVGARRMYRTPTLCIEG